MGFPFPFLIQLYMVPKWFHLLGFKSLGSVIFLKVREMFQMGGLG